MNIFTYIYRILMKNLRRLSVLSQPFYLQRDKWTCPVIHIRNLTKLSPSFVLPLLCGFSKGKITCPPELTILLVHNYKKKPIMEQSLHYIGIDNYVVMKADFEGSWINTIKLLEVKKFLDSPACQTEYVLFCDSDDAVIRDDPAKVIQYLKDEDCDLLLSNTNWLAGYECMPDIKDWADKNALENGRKQCYINSGVYIGRTEFLKEVINATMEYITDKDLPCAEYWEILDEGRLSERLPGFPTGVGSCQVILRYLHPRYYPRMKIDFKDRLAMR